MVTMHSSTSTQRVNESFLIPRGQTHLMARSRIANLTLIATGRKLRTRDRLDRLRNIVKSSTYPYYRNDTVAWRCTVLAKLVVNWRRA